MLAGIEEALQAGPAGKAEEEMSAIETLLAGLFDYAGLYPPACLSLRSVVDNYFKYGHGEQASALGRFIINYDAVDELRSVAGDSLGNVKLSVIAAEDADWDVLTRQIGSGLRIESLEIKSSKPSIIERITQRVPRDVMTYFEVPIHAESLPPLEAIRAAGARAKIRMGGVVPEGIPSIPNVIKMLKTLAELRLPFKATAGLHHPLRSLRPLTYEPQSPIGVMHGFVNLACAAALIYFGGDADDARCVLGEEDSTAWQVNGDAIHWRDRSWTTEQLATMRREFFMSIGSCSFEEPIRDLERLGWL
jgi:hypothetical protein